MATSVERFQRRHVGVTTRAQGEEILVLDSHLGTAHCLSGNVATVWQAIGAGCSANELVIATRLSSEELVQALATLDEAGLLESGGIGRRALLGRGAALAAAAAVGIGITSIALPAAAAAGSPTLTIVNNGCATTLGLKTGVLKFTATITNALPNTTYTVTFLYPTAVLATGLLSGTGSTTVTVRTDASGNGSTAGTTGNVLLAFGGGSVSATGVPTSGTSLVWSGSFSSCALL